MADLKANMLLTMSSIILTLSFPQIFNPRVKATFVVLIVFCLITIFFAFLAAMPKIRLRTTKKTRKDFKGPNFDILFFGDFCQMTLEEFEDGMEDVTNDPSGAYAVQVRGLYLMGQYLRRKKFYYINLAYTSFFTGIFVTAVVFGVTYLLR